MDDTHHSTSPAPKKPRRCSFTCSSSTCAIKHYPPNTMTASQIITPPLTPPRSPRSSLSSHPPTAPKDHTPPRVHFNLQSSPRTASPATAMCESSLWTLPGSSVFEEPGASPASQTGNRWARLLQRAALSNRERHQARLEGDGWAFVGGRYSGEGDEGQEGGECVDAEFDGVVLARESDGC